MNAQTLLISLVSRYLTTKDLISFIGTSLDAYGAALPELLLRRPHILLPGQLLSLCHLLSISPARAYPALSKLVINITEFAFTKSCLPLVTELLSRATHLRILRIQTFYLDLEDAIVRALLHLNTLHCLELVGDVHTPAVQRIFAQLHAPLRAIALDASGNTSGANLNPLPLLTRFAGTLRTVVLPFAFFPDDPACLWCPYVSELTSAPCFVPLLSSLVPAFPNIKTLCIEHELWGSSSPEADAGLTAIRQRNIAYQRARGGWRNIACVVADEAALYAMGLQCNVASLTITSPVTLSDEFSFNPLLQDLLMPLRLTHLRLCSITDPADLEQIFSAKVGAHLQRLDIVLELAQIEDDKLWDSVNSVIRAIKHTKITVFDLSIVYGVDLNNLAGVRASVYQFMDHFWGKSLMLFDQLRQLALYARQMAPSLQFITIALGNTTWRPPARAYFICRNSLDGVLDVYDQDDVLAKELFSRKCLPPQTQKAYRSRALL